MDTPRRRLVADAALHVLARDGSRGLTHRAVDEFAGLPAGSTSYYHRSRAALLSACVRRLVDRDHAELDAISSVAGATDPAALADALARLLHHWMSVDRHRHLARYELTMEAVRRPDVAEELRRAGQDLRDRIAAILASFGAADPPRQARLLVACIDGILFDNLAGAGAANPMGPAALHAAAHDLLAAVLPAPAASGPGRGGA
jgi:DNA-binding transcriptional regulator YbjK